MTRTFAAAIERLFFSTSETKQHSTLSVFDSLIQALWITALFWIVHPFGEKNKTENKSLYGESSDSSINENIFSFPTIVK